MGKRLVVGLDPSDYSRAAARAAIDLARQLGGSVTALAIIDEPSIDRAEAGGHVGAGPFAWQAHQYHLEHAEKLCRELLSGFAADATAAAVPAEGKLARGVPSEVLADESSTADLLLLGTRTYFGFEVRDRPDRALERLLHESSCPVLAVPAVGFAPAKALVAYDGSVEAARSLRAFVYLTEGLESARHVDLLWVGRQATTGEDVLAGPMRFLEAHERAVHRRIELGGAPLVVLSAARGAMPAWIVLGASSHGRLRQRLLGGVTRTLIDDGVIPIFAAP